MTDREMAVALLRDLLALRARMQTAHDAHLMDRLADSEPGSPMEQRDNNLQGVLRCLDDAVAATRLVLETIDVMTRHEPALVAWKADRA